MNKYPSKLGPIGVFDSGYGGLTILEKMRKELPEYDFIYLGDNARAPYGTRSFDIVYEFTLQAVDALFKMGSPLVILACNTASAKALRTIQQCDLPGMDATRRVLGVIRPTAEQVAEMSKTGHVGVFATAGTIRSQSYALELKKLNPDLVVTGEACPMWVPLVENHEAESAGADYFVKQHVEALMKRDAQIDTVILGCTHYPILEPKIRKYLPPRVRIVSQGELVANSLVDYLQRHPEIDERISKGGTCRFYTSESHEKFADFGELFLKEPIVVEHIVLPSLKEIDEKGC